MLPVECNQSTRIQANPLSQTISPTLPGWAFLIKRGGRIRLHLLPMGANYGVAAVESGGKQGSTGALHFIFESISLASTTKNRYPKG